MNPQQNNLVGFNQPAAAFNQVSSSCGSSAPPAQRPRQSFPGPGNGSSATLTVTRNTSQHFQPCTRPRNREVKPLLSADFDF